MQQENSLKLVSFIVGLLIGGMLVWAFSVSTSEEPSILITQEEVFVGVFRQSLINATKDCQESDGEMWVDVVGDIVCTVDSVDYEYYHFGWQAELPLTK